jgi:hypothetical protein
MNRAFKRKIKAPGAQKELCWGGRRRAALPTRQPVHKQLGDRGWPLLTVAVSAELWFDQVNWLVNVRCTDNAPPRSKSPAKPSKPAGKQLK